MPRTPSPRKAATTPSPRKSTSKKRQLDAEPEEEVEASPRKRRDRFNGLSDDQVMERRLPDRLAPNLDILIVGFNPGLLAAYEGHHYVGPNHFWKCIELSGLVPRLTDKPLNAYDDDKLLEYGIGFTTIVARPTKGSADLSRKEIREGVEVLTDKIKKFRPKIVVFNGKGIYEVFSGKKEFNFGKQPEKVGGTDTVVWVMPSSSARCAQLPRAVDKAPYYVALKKLKDHLRGDLPNLDDSEVVFPDLKGSNHSEGAEKPATDE